MPNTAPADELRAATAPLVKQLPGDLTATPRLVVTDSESLTGIAFCVDHQLPREFPHEYSACDYCEVIDCKHEQLAALVHALLLARAPLAAWLESWVGVPFSEHGPMLDDLTYALRIARIVNGTGAP